jgi:hypothetical protein
LLAILVSYTCSLINDTCYWYLLLIFLVDICQILKSHHLLSGIISTCLYLLLTRYWYLLFTRSWYLILMLVTDTCCWYLSDLKESGRLDDVAARNRRLPAEIKETITSLYLQPVFLNQIVNLLLKETSFIRDLLTCLWLKLALPVKYWSTVLQNKFTLSTRVAFTGNQRAGLEKAPINSPHNYKTEKLYGIYHDSFLTFRFRTPSLFMPSSLP